MVLFLGDLNAKVDSENTDREHVIGKHGTFTINDNGEELAIIEFCEENSLVIRGTLFQHKYVHKTTLDITRWDHQKPDRSNHHQSKMEELLRDVRAYRRADVACDHILILAIISLKFRQLRKRRTRQQKLDSGRLNETVTKQAFAVEKRNRFQALREQQKMTIETFKIRPFEKQEKKY
jgi:hypothetical protein